MNLPDDEQLLRELGGTKFRSPEEWAKAVEGESKMGQSSPEELAKTKEMVRAWAAEREAEQGPNVLVDVLSQKGPVQFSALDPANLGSNAPRRPIREQQEEHVDEVMRNYPFPCITPECRARVKEEGATCALHGSLPPRPKSILLIAQDLVHGDRARAYGSPDVNHGFTAKLFLEWLKGRYTSAYANDHLGNPQPSWPEEAVCSFDAYDVCVFNMLQKLSRTAHQLRSEGAPHRDSLVDIAGYAANMDMIDQERRSRGT